MAEPAKERATAWLEERRAVLAAEICVEWDYPAKRDLPEYQRRAEVVAAVADVIVGLTGQVPVFVVAVTITRLGLDSLCGVQ